VAYCAQQPFILQGTLRQNIEFGEKQLEGDDELAAQWRLAKVMDACALTGDDGMDLDRPVAAHGLNLSGGQKARVSLINLDN
jgi:ABC-type multidrug transport system fused ATPase/permease subunit